MRINKKSLWLPIVAPILFPYYDSLQPVQEPILKQFIHENHRRENKNPQKK